MHKSEVRGDVLRPTPCINTSCGRNQCHFTLDVTQSAKLVSTSVEPDQTLRSAASDFGLHYLLRLARPDT